jgi:hypothetical protein
MIRTLKYFKFGFEVPVTQLPKSFKAEMEYSNEKYKRLKISCDCPLNIDMDGHTFYGTIP